MGTFCSTMSMRNENAVIERYHRGVHQAHFPAEPNLGFKLLHDIAFLTDRMVYAD